MSQISKYSIEKNLYDEIYEVFVQTLVELNSRNTVNGFLNEFFTPTEKIIFTKRLACGILIAQGFDYRETANLLKMSTSTISTYSLYYKYGKSYKVVIDNIIKNKKISNMFIKLGEVISRVGNMGSKGSGAWREINKNLKNKQSKILR